MVYFSNSKNTTDLEHKSVIRSEKVTMNIKLSDEHQKRLLDEIKYLSSLRSRSLSWPARILLRYLLVCLEINSCLLKFLYLVTGILKATILEPNMVKRC